MRTHKILDKQLDSREPQRKRKYFQTLLTLSAHLTANPKIASAQPQSYYELVLRNERVEPDQGDKHYRLQLKDGSVGLLALPPPPPEFAAIENGSDEDFDIAMIGDAVEVVSEAVRKPEPKPDRKRKSKADPPKHADKHKSCVASGSSGDASKSSSSDSSSSSSSATSHSFDVAKGRSDVRAYIEIERGPRVKLDIYKPEGKSQYKRWILECTFHDGCDKKRSTTIAPLHGPVEPIAYLVAWNKKGFDLTREQHQARRFYVSPEEVAQAVVSLGDRAQPLLDQL